MVESNNLSRNNYKNNILLFNIVLFRFFNEFLFRLYNDSEVHNFLYEFLHPGIESFCININGIAHQMYCRYPQTLLDMKKAVSFKTGLPVQNFYFINYRKDEKPKDDDKYDDNIFREMEFVSNCDEIDILKLLGHGAFGEIWLCRSKSTGKELILKKPLGENNDLFREINNQYRFKFSNILFSYLKLFNFDGNVCLAMDYFPEGSLTSFLAAACVLEPLIAKWCHQLLIQLDELHNEGMIHRDIKGENILLDKNFNAYLIDFGISKRISHVSSTELLDNLKKYINGTAHYMAPEYIRCETYSNKIDIWSFGATVIEMVSGKKPYFNDNSIKASINITTKQVIKFKPRKPLSNELKNFINLCLIPDQNGRPSARQLLESEFILKHLTET